MAPDRRTLLDTALAFTRSYDEWTLEAALSVRAPDCVHQLHPLSMGRPPMDNDALKVYFGKVRWLFKDYKVHVTEEDMFVDVEKRTVTFNAKGTAETTLGPFNNEYVFILKMDEAGTKIREIHETVDSAAVANLVPRLKEFQGAPPSN